MTMRSDLGDLVDYLQKTSRLSRSEAERVVDNVIAFLAESVEEFIRRRHQEFQSEGRANAEIYALLREETSARLFRAPSYSDRQIRRIIYG